MAELVDAADSKSAVRKDVQVRFLFWAQNHFYEWFFYVLKSPLVKHEVINQSVIIILDEALINLLRS
jgi:hypothetical protein